MKYALIKKKVINYVAISTVWGLPRWYASFSSDGVESPSWSCMLSQSEHDQPLDGWPQHVTKWWQRSDSEVWWPASQRAGCSGALCARYGRVCPGTTVDVVRWRGARHSERTHVKLRDEASLRRGKCSDQYMRNLYCLASELAFLVMR